MTNLLQDTLRVLNMRDKFIAEVLWVGTREKSCSWQSFAREAADVNYDAGFGGQEINPTLLVVGVDWWLERHEYDGSEWWEFKTLPKQPEFGVVQIREEY